MRAQGKEDEGDGGLATKVHLVTPFAVLSMIHNPFSSSQKEIHRET